MDRGTYHMLKKNKTWCLVTYACLVFKFEVTLRGTLKLVNVFETQVWLYALAQFDEAYQYYFV